MTRWLVTAAILGAALLGALFYIARPDAVEHRMAQLVTPIREALASRQAERLAQEKAAARAAWMARFEAGADCIAPASSLKQMECRNRQDDWAGAFERHWAQRPAGG